MEKIADQNGVFVGGRGHAKSAKLQIKLFIYYDRRKSKFGEINFL